MSFVGVMVQPQSVDVGVGVLKFCDLFAGKIGWEAPLPELVFAFDFAFGFRGWGIKEANVVELESRAQLGIDGRLWEPAMGGGVELPDFADLGTLPATNWCLWFFGRSCMGMTVLKSPVAHLSTIQFETMEAEGLRGYEAVGTRWRAGQTFYEQVDDCGRPRCGVVAAGSAGRPKVSLFLNTSAEIIGGEKIKLAAGEAELVGRFCSGQGALLKGFKNMANKRVGVPVEQLLALLITGENTAQRCPKGQSFRQPSLRSDFLKDWPLGQFH